MGTGLKQQRLPSEWEKRPLEMSGAQAQGPQGPAKGWYGSEKAQGGGERRSLAPVGHNQSCENSEINDAVDQAAGGGLINQIVLGRPGVLAQKARPGNDDNVSGSPGGRTGGLPGPNVGGSRAKTTGTHSPHVVGGNEPKRGSF